MRTFITFHTFDAQSLAIDPMSVCAVYHEGPGTSIHYGQARVVSVRESYDEVLRALHISAEVAWRSDGYPELPVR